jgi:DNA-binding IclR family transcriptional regulator
MLHTVSKAGMILNLFSEKTPEWGVSEMAKKLELPKSTVSEMMATLASLGLLERTSSGRYRLGWQLYALSQTLLDTTDFYPEARRAMHELVERWGETTSLAVLSGSEIIYVEKQQAAFAVYELLERMNIHAPAYSSSLGKVLLAHRKWDDVLGLFKGQKLSALTPRTIVTLEDLKQELEQVRRQGYAIDEEEVAIGVCGVSAPIYDLDGNVTASISLVLPTQRFSPHRESYAGIILKTAQKISANIGYRPKKQHAQKRLIDGDDDLSQAGRSSAMSRDR